MTVFVGLTLGSGFALLILIVLVRLGVFDEVGMVGDLAVYLFLFFLYLSIILRLTAH